METNKHITRIIAALVGTGTIAPSCSGYMNEYQVKESELSDEGVSAITMNLSKEEADYLNFLIKLCEDVVDTPIVAREFSKNPQLFVEKYGYKEFVDIEENMLKLILALGDDDINEAIKTGNIKDALILMKDKGLLDSNSYSKINLSEEQTKELLKAFNIDTSDEIALCTTVAAACIFYVVVGAVSVLVVAYTALAGVTAVASLAVATKVEAYGTYSNYNKQVSDNNPILKIWCLKGNTTKTVAAIDLYIEEQTNKLLDAIEAVDENAFNKRITKEQFRNFIRLNMMQ